MKVDPRKSTYLACCLLMRGKMSIADMNRNVMRLKPNLCMVHWNSDGFKLGICSKPPVGRSSMCCLCAVHVMSYSTMSGSAIMMLSQVLSLFLPLCGTVLDYPYYYHYIFWWITAHTPMQAKCMPLTLDSMFKNQCLSVSLHSEPLQFSPRPHTVWPQKNTPCLQQPLSLPPPTP